MRTYSVTRKWIFQDALIMHNLSLLLARYEGGTLLFRPRKGWLL